ncbi:hypothetical protein VNI00_004071 [Paramarasmius palmivorus]|uniref:GRF-type domain-containing protein n=1 Tax=Paramarasmius palmivorus TaxID=297713 RepID=A0AAW0DPJ4_9AGAR
MSQTPTQSQTRTVNASCFDSNGTVVCYHDEPAARKTSRTEANPNRDFFCCAKDRERCKFWKWADELTLPGAEPSPQRQTTNGIPSQSYTRPEIAMSGSQKRPLEVEATELTSTPKRPRTNASHTPGGSIQRLSAIEAGLRGEITPSSSQGKLDRNAAILEALTPGRNASTSKPQATEIIEDEDENPFLAQPPTSRTKGKGKAPQKVDIPDDSDDDTMDNISADTLSDSIRSLEKVHKYVRKLEKMNVAKEMKIAKLQKRVDILERRLEE